MRDVDAVKGVLEIGGPHADGIDGERDTGGSCEDLQKFIGGKLARNIFEKIGNFLVSFTSIDEQQKIADCLSSLDELITAQTQKIAMLKTHKKGLMQQLFPNAPTESTP